MKPATRRGRGWRAAAWLVLGLFALGGIARELQFLSNRARVLQGSPEARLLGRHFMVGYTSLDEVAALSARGLIGGIYVTRRNVERKSAAELRAEIASLQATRQAAGLPPLWVAADQEGGEVAHLSPLLEPLPALRDWVGAAEGRQLETLARQYGERQARGLASVGVNLNLGPVVDLMPRYAGPLVDVHTRIASRAISADPQRVARVSGAYAAGALAEGVRPTLKHFPGLGRVEVDTHFFAGRLQGSVEELARTDWLPFRETAKLAGAMMVGHVVVEAVDAEAPASLSKAVVGGLLRGQWGFDGIVITDDLNMGPVARRGICRATVEALQAGVDLLLLAYDAKPYYRAMTCASAALRRGELDPAGLAASRRRLDRGPGLPPAPRPPAEPSLHSALDAPGAAASAPAGYHLPTS